MKNTLSLPTPTSQQVAKTLPSQPHNVSRGMVQLPNDMFAEIMNTENECIQTASLITPSSQQVAKKSPSQIKNQLPGQLSQKHHRQQAGNVPKGRGRGRNVTQAAHARHLAQGAPRPRPARLPSTVRPSPPLRYSQMRPRIPGYPVSQQHTPTVTSVHRPRLSSTGQRVLFRPESRPVAHSTPTVSSVLRPSINPGLSRTGPMQRILCTPEPQPVAQPPVVELDLETSPIYDHALAPINNSTMSIPDLVLPPGISITRNPPAHSIDTGSISASNLTSLARALVMVGDNVGKKCRVLYEITESQIQGLRNLGLSEKRI